MKTEIKYTISMWILNLALNIMPDNEFKVKFSIFIVNNLKVGK